MEIMLTKIRYKTFSRTVVKCTFELRNRVNTCQRRKQHVKLQFQPFCWSTVLVEPPGTAYVKTPKISL